MNVLSLILLGLIALPVAYLYLVALASIPVSHTRPSEQPHTRFAIAIPAHNEEVVIANTVKTLRQVNYPQDLFEIFVVADHCSDRTAENARNVGAICWGRIDEPRGSKGAALAWLFQRIFAVKKSYDAVVVFDADTRVDPAFLQIMDARLRQGVQVVQGCHRIGNPEDTWFAALTWAMFIVDNRFQNQGRTNLGWSAKNMGDSICFRADILRRLGWGEGLTEDYEFRQKLLLEGIKIQYEPKAIGYGEAAINWAVARTQRARWLSGTYRASRNYAGEMLRRGLKQLDPSLLDGTAQAFLPSYSTLTVLAVAGVILNFISANWLDSLTLKLWIGLLLLLGIYPLIGLVLERAPWRAYIAIWLGPIFILWRTALSIAARFGKKNVVWVRTLRRDDVQATRVQK